MDRRRSYPYLVIRLMPAVYERREIVFTGGTEDSVPTPEALILADAKPFDRYGNLSKRCRAMLLEAALGESKRRNLEMCLVFGEKDCVYVRPAGTASASSQPPKGGLWFRFRRKGAL